MEETAIRETKGVTVELLATIDRFVAVGTTKFVVLPIVEPASPDDWVAHLEEAAPILLARQT